MTRAATRWPAPVRYFGSVLAGVACRRENASSALAIAQPRRLRDHCAERIGRCE
jgi:hypothetical protein